MNDRRIDIGISNDTTYIIEKKRMKAMNYVIDSRKKDFTSRRPKRQSLYIYIYKCVRILAKELTAVTRVRQNVNKQKLQHIIPELTYVA